MFCPNSACIEKNAGFFEHDFLIFVVAVVLQTSTAKPNSPCSCWKIVGNIFSCWSIGWEKFNFVMRDHIYYLISPLSDYKRRACIMYWKTMGDGEISCCNYTIPHRLSLIKQRSRICKQFYAWLIQERVAI